MIAIYRNRFFYAPIKSAMRIFELTIPIPLKSALLDKLLLHSDAGPLSQALAILRFSNASQLTLYLQNLPYTRISDPNDLSLVLSERRGTCSSKHAFLQSVALEQQWEDMSLVLCLFKMNAINTPGIGNGIAEAGLDYIPEAHCYVKYGEQCIDVTRPGASIEKIKQDILLEIEIQPNQVGDWKKDYHKAFIKDWQSQAKIPHSFEALWLLREACIASLSQK